MKLVPTEELYHEIKNATDPEDFLAKNSSQMLRHICECFCHKKHDPGRSCAWFPAGPFLCLSDIFR